MHSNRISSHTERKKGWWWWWLCFYFENETDIKKQPAHFALQQSK